MRFIAIDFEASCLPTYGLSYPIEVGIALGADDARSWLIRPDPEWTEWDWSPDAEALHGIYRDQLFREGVPAISVFEELLVAIDGREIIADSYLDAHWMGVLAGAAHSDIVPKVSHIERVIDYLHAAPDEIEEAISALSEGRYQRHRAAEDARWVAALIEELTERATLRDALATVSIDNGGRRGRTLVQI